MYTQCHYYTPLLSASDQVFLLPGVVTLWWGLLVQHPWIALLFLLGKLKLCKILPFECWWKISNLGTIHTLLFLLLLRISHDSKTNPFRIDSKIQLSACTALALRNQPPLCYWLAYSRQISSNLGISGFFGDSIRETFYPGITWLLLLRYQSSNHKRSSCLESISSNWLMLVSTCLIGIGIFLSFSLIYGCSSWYIGLNDLFLLVLTIAELFPKASIFCLSSFFIMMLSVPCKVEL